MALFVMVVGLFVYLITSLIIIVKAFRVSALWGLAAMFIPFAALVFVIQNWEDTKKPFLIGVAGFAAMMFGMLTSPDVKSAQEKREAQKKAISASRTEKYSYASSTPTQPASPSYTPSYTPPPQPTATETQASADQAAGKPKLEQVMVDRDKGVYYSAKCKKLPENVYKLAKSVAKLQGMQEAPCP